MQTIRSTKAPLILPEILQGCLPAHLIDAVRRCGATDAEELRLHSERCATVTCGGRSFGTGVILTAGEMQEILKRMCGGSLYAFSQSINQGYLTLAGGIRVGVCGNAAVEGGQVIGVSHVTGLMIRIPHAVSVDPAPVLAHFCAGEGTRGLLIYAPPGVGKTTLLRAITRSLASPSYAYRTVVVDTREELQFTLDGKELNLDILVGYPRDIGIGIAVRSMSAQVIVCDEIGDTADARAILAAANCGVPLIATAHASSHAELLCRPALQLLHRAHVFESYVGIQRSGTGFSYRFTKASEISLPPSPSHAREVVWSS